jgi:hypothetical protein
MKIICLKTLATSRKERNRLSLNRILARRRPTTDNGSDQTDRKCFRTTTLKCKYHHELNLFRVTKLQDDVNDRDQMVAHKNGTVTLGTKK